MSHIVDEAGRTRVRIVEAQGTPITAGLVAADPEPAKAHFDVLGWMTDEPCPALGGRKNPHIVLDDGGELWGYQCWWDYVRPDPAE